MKWRLAVLRTLVFVAAALVTVVTIAYWFGTWLR